ncbi:MAG: hypothetical protein RL077_2639 [Verrucomicrobiota bacterium]
MQREATEKKWAELVSRCRAPRWGAPFWYQSAIFLVLLGYFRFASQPGDYRGVMVVTAIYLICCVPSYVVSQRKREKALLAMIEREAPELYRKLQHEDIA